MTAPNHTAAAAEVFDEIDPHGFDQGHSHGHGHVIVGPFTLRSVLVALLFLTALTVAVAQAEVWAEHYFHIVLPWWVNVVGAMSIAVVKALLVMAFFMQLKYDNPINTVLMLFCISALAIFLGFSGMDLFNRALVDPIRGTSPVPGGDIAGGKPLVASAADNMVEYLAVTGTLDEAAIEPAHADIAASIKSLVTEIRLNHRYDALKYANDAIHKQVVAAGSGPTGEEWTKLVSTLKADTPEARAQFAEIAETLHRAHGGGEEAAPVGSTADQSRPKIGLSGALSDSKPAVSEGEHAAEH